MKNIKTVRPKARMGSGYSPVSQLCPGGKQNHNSTCSPNNSKRRWDARLLMVSFFVVGLSGNFAAKGQFLSI